MSTGNNLLHGGMDGQPLQLVGDIALHLGAASMTGQHARNSFPGAGLGTLHHHPSVVADAYICAYHWTAAWYARDTKQRYVSTVHA